MSFKDFPERLRTMRMARNLTQGDLGKRIGVSASAVGMYEQGRREPSFEILEALADVFNVPIDALYGEEDIDRDLWELRDSIRRDPNTRMLYSLARRATKEDIEEAIEFLQARQTIRRIKGE